MPKTTAFSRKAAALSRFRRARSARSGARVGGSHLLSRLREWAPFTAPAVIPPLTDAAGRRTAAPSRRRNVRTAGFLGIELKFLDSGGSAVAIPAPADASGGEMQPEYGCTGCLSAPAQGDGEQQRDGRKMMMKSLFVSGVVAGNTLAAQAGVAEPPDMMVALVLDTQANGATLISEQVYTNPNDTAVINSKLWRNLQFSSRYRVMDTKLLRGKHHESQDAVGTSSQDMGSLPFTFAWNGNIPVTFTGAGADVANVTDNAFHIVAFATNATYTPALTWNARMRFVG